MSESKKSPESRGARLKQDLDRLFSPELANIEEQSEWTIFLYRDIKRFLSVKDWPRSAGAAAVQGLAPKRVTGYPSILFDRQQHAVRFLGIEKITRDEVGLSVAFSNHGNDYETVYSNYVDMTKPTVEYDERLAAVVQACIDNSSSTEH